jgi:hypothetical protein
VVSVVAAPLVAAVVLPGAVADAVAQVAVVVAGALVVLAADAAVPVVLAAVVAPVADVALKAKVTADANLGNGTASSFTAGYTPLYVVTTGTAVVTGIEDHRGGTRPFRTQAMTANGAILETSDFVTLNKTGVLAATIAAPRAGRLLVITQTDAGTDGHTVTLTAGTFNGSNTVATLNAAGEALVLYGVSATRFVIVENIGSVALSGT